MAIMVGGLFILAVISGMLGLGVAFAAIPWLSFFLPDLVHQVHPVSLLLNGVTAMFAIFGFAMSGHIDWKKAILLTIVCTIFAPVGSFVVQYISQTIVWFVYFFAVAYLAYRMFTPVKERPGEEKFTLALILSAPIAILSGFLGVGPGFLLLPTLIIVGFATKKAAGITAFAVTLPSFSALIPHIPTAQWEPGILLPLLIAGAIGSFAGARVTSLYVPGARVKQMFGILIVIMTIYNISSMF